MAVICILYLILISKCSYLNAELITNSSVLTETNIKDSNGAMNTFSNITNFNETENSSFETRTLLLKSQDTDWNISNITNATNNNSAINDTNNISFNNDTNVNSLFDHTNNSIAKNSSIFDIANNFTLNNISNNTILFNNESHINNLNITTMFNNATEFNTSVQNNTIYDTDINSTIFAIDNQIGIHNKTILKPELDNNVTDTVHSSNNSIFYNDTSLFYNETNVINITTNTNITGLNITTPIYNYNTTSPNLITRNFTRQYNNGTVIFKPNITGSKNTTKSDKNSSSSLKSFLLWGWFVYYLILYYV